MALLRKGHPWIAGYAIPQNVIDEPYRRGAIVSGYRKRKTIDGNLRNPRNPGGWPPYILPQSVRDEPLGQGVRTTHYRKRGTISGLVPEIVTAGVHTERQGVGIFDNDTKGGQYGVLSGSSLSKSVLGAAGQVPGGGRDGISQFAKEAAARIMADARTVPVAHRKIFVQTVLANIDRSFVNKVESKTAELMAKKKYTAKVAMQRAMAIVFATSALDQLMTMGRTGKVPTSGLLGLGCEVKGQLGLGFGWSDVKSAAKKTTGVLLAPVTGGASLALTFPGTAEKVADKAKTALNKVGDVFCKVANTGLLKIGAMAGGAAAGGPGGAQAGAAGADVSQALCTPAAQAPVAPTSSFPVVPIAIGAGALLLVVLLAR